MKKLNLSKRATWLAAVITAIILLGIAVLLLALLTPKVYSLDSTPVTTKIPVFQQNADRVAGWEKASTSDIPNATGLTRVTYQNNAKTCQFITTTLMYPVYYTQRGDRFLSKAALYDHALQVQKLIKQEGVSEISTSTGQKLQVSTGRFNATIAAKKRTVMIAVRAVDKLYKLPVSAISSSDTNVFGLDPNLGIPVLSVNYTCNSGKGSTAEFQQLLNAVHVNLK